MPALVASRYDADLKAKYDQLIRAGKTGKVALTAIMRKLIVTANALLRDGRKSVRNQALTKTDTHCSGLGEPEG